MSGYRLADSLWNKFVRSMLGQLIDAFPEGWLAGCIMLFVVTLPLSIVGGIFGWVSWVVAPLVIITVVNPCLVVLVVAYDEVRERQELKRDRWRR